MQKINLQDELGKTNESSVFFKRGRYQVGTELGFRLSSEWRNILNAEELIVFESNGFSYKARITAIHQDTLNIYIEIIEVLS